MSNHIPKDNLSYAVLLSINEGKSLGSGFRLKANGKNYLITAKHVLFDRHDKLYGETLIITCHSPNKEATKPWILQVELDKATILTSNKFDIAAVLLGHNIPVDGYDHITPLKKLTTEVKRQTQLILESYVTPIEHSASAAVSVDIEAIGLLDAVTIANDVYLLGYPTSLGLQKSQFYDFSKPLVRKGIVAGINESKSSFVIDCPVYPGNSGGPVVENCADGYFRVTGIVSRYIPYETKWHSNHDDIVNTEMSNSGYTVCISMDALLELLPKIAA